jgi:cation-transporting ATPase 13A3/4/5
VSFEELVPGDVVNIIEESLTFFPADMLLLSGDTIVNESMLTGESVPIAKVPVKDQDIIRWNEGAPIGAELAKSFLYTGTKIVRIRGILTSTGGSHEQALAVVVRTGDKALLILALSSYAFFLPTGFDTTKGSLIRSMLFPRPMGFKFYRDSMRFVIFLAGVAGLGFLASAVQFIKLGVCYLVLQLPGPSLISSFFLDQVPHYRSPRPGPHNDRRAPSITRHAFHRH